MKIKVTKSISILTAVLIILSFSTTCLASDMDTDFSDGVISPRGNDPPLRRWDWSDGTYIAHSEYVYQYTWTNYSLLPNENGYIYYWIDGESDYNRQCRLEAHCMDCNTIVNTRYFYPNSSPLMGVVDADIIHKNHDFAFKLVVYEGDDDSLIYNNFSGYIYFSDYPFAR